MATQTTNFGLTKPSEDDFYNIGVQNGNMDIIDGALKTIDNKSGIQADWNESNSVAIGFVKNKPDVPAKRSPGILTTGSKTLAPADEDTIQRCVSANEIIISVPDDSVPWPLNGSVLISRSGTGPVKVLPTSETVTLRSVDDKRNIKGQFGYVTVVKMGPNYWELFGSLE